jgi:hypothetical protein
VDECSAWPDAWPLEALTDFISLLLLDLAGTWGMDNDHALRVVWVLPPSEWSGFVGSRLQAQSHIVVTGFFDANQAKWLGESLNIPEDECAGLYEHFIGHPSHFHLALWKRHCGESVQSILDSSESSDGLWGGIWQRVHSQLGRLSQNRGVSRDALLSKYVDLVADAPTSGVTLSRDEFDILKSLGMIDGGLHRPRAGKFFSLLAQYALKKEER